MSLVMPTVGERYFLDRALKGTNNGNSLTLRLYSACATAGGVPAAASVAADFTEATFAGYASATLAPASWGAGAGTPGASTYGAAQIFTRTSTGANEGEGGWVHKDDLGAKAEHGWQGTSRLKGELSPYLGGVELLENDGSGRYRLNTPLQLGDVNLEAIDQLGAQAKKLAAEIRERRPAPKPASPSARRRRRT